MFMWKNRYIVGTRYHTSICESGMNCIDLPCMHLFTFKKLVNSVLWCIFLFTLERSDRVICSFSLSISRNSWYLAFLSSAHTITFFVHQPQNNAVCHHSERYRLHGEAQDHMRLLGVFKIFSRLSQPELLEKNCCMVKLHDVHA